MREMALSLVPQAFKKSGVLHPKFHTLCCPDFIFSLLFFFLPEITAPTLWIKHLVIKDSKLNNTNIRNSGKLPWIMCMPGLSMGATWLLHDCPCVGLGKSFHRFGLQFLAQL